NGGTFTATSLNFNIDNSLSASSINTGGGDVLINSIGAGGDVKIYGNVRTNGGSFTVGTVGDDTTRPANFYSAFDDEIFGTIDTFSSSRGYGSINIAVAGDAVLGQLRSTNASGNPTGSKGDVTVLAGNN